jgi:hypothetical protein
MFPINTIGFDNLSIHYTNTFVIKKLTDYTNTFVIKKLAEINPDKKEEEIKSEFKVIQKGVVIFGITEITEMEISPDAYGFKLYPSECSTVIPNTKEILNVICKKK